jgi:hypothetical protein
MKPQVCTMWGTLHIHVRTHLHFCVYACVWERERLFQSFIIILFTVALLLK